MKQESQFDTKYLEHLLSLFMMMYRHLARSFSQVYLRQFNEQLNFLNLMTTKGQWLLKFKTCKFTTRLQNWWTSSLQHTYGSPGNFSDHQETNNISQCKSQSRNWWTMICTPKLRKWSTSQVQVYLLWLPINSTF